MSYADEDEPRMKHGSNTDQEWKGTLRSTRQRCGCTIRVRSVFHPWLAAPGDLPTSDT
jgi:hypothetical protein